MNNNRSTIKQPANSPRAQVPAFALNGLDQFAMAVSQHQVSEIIDHMDKGLQERLTGVIMPAEDAPSHERMLWAIKLDCAVRYLIAAEMRGTSMQFRRIEQGQAQ